MRGVGDESEGGKVMVVTSGDDWFCWDVWRGAPTVSNNVLVVLMLHRNVDGCAHPHRRRLRQVLRELLPFLSSAL